MRSQFLSVFFGAALTAFCAFSQATLDDVVSELQSLASDVQGVQSEVYATGLLQVQQTEYLLQYFMSDSEYYNPILPQVYIGGGVQALSVRDNQMFEWVRDCTEENYDGPLVSGDHFRVFDQFNAVEGLVYNGSNAKRVYLQNMDELETMLGYVLTDFWDYIGGSGGILGEDNSVSVGNWDEAAVSLGDIELGEGESQPDINDILPDALSEMDNDNTEVSDKMTELQTVHSDTLTALADVGANNGFLTVAREYMSNWSDAIKVFDIGACYLFELGTATIGPNNEYSQTFSWTMPSATVTRMRLVEFVLYSMGLAAWVWYRITKVGRV